MQDKIDSMVMEEDFIGQDILTDITCLIHNSDKSLEDRLHAAEQRCGWLLVHFDKLHEILCPGKEGTLPQRVEQCIDAAQEAVKAMQGGWIPVSMRLPDAKPDSWSENVMVCNEKGQISIDTYFLRSDGTGFWMYQPEGQQPTHWVSIPPKPEE